MTITSSESSVRTGKRDQFHILIRIRVKAYYSSGHSQKQIVRLLNVLDEMNSVMILKEIEIMPERCREVKRQRDLQIKY
jgi:hypothetical protein